MHAKNPWRIWPLWEIFIGAEPGSHTGGRRLPTGGVALSVRERERGLASGEVGHECAIGLG